MSGVGELIQWARRHVERALEYEREGSIGEAIDYYERAVGIFKKLVDLYPLASSEYEHLIGVFERKIQELKQRAPKSTGAETSIRDLLLTDIPRVSWNDIVGLEEAKQAILESIVYPAQRPELFPLGWPTGILLYGPPGCGKTLLAAAAANEIDAFFLCVDAASIMSKWLGESEKNVARLFDEAENLSKKGKPVIIYIDEVDSLMGVRTAEVGGEVRVRNEFLSRMDGLTSKGRKRFIYVIAATNRPWVLDLPFIRRFQRRLYIPLPNHEARLRLFKFFTRNLQLADDVDFEELAKMTEGFSGSDIQSVVQDAHLAVVREVFSGGKVRPISMEDFKAVIRKRKPSISKEMIWAYEKFAEQYGG